MMASVGSESSSALHAGCTEASVELHFRLVRQLNNDSKPLALEYAPLYAAAVARRQAGEGDDSRGNRMSASHASKGRRRWRYYVSRAALTGRKQDAGSTVRIPAAEIETRITRAVVTHLAGRASAIEDWHINRGVLSGNQAIPQHEQTRRLRWDPPTEKVRNAIERATASATRIEILLNESVVAEGQYRVLTLPWTRPSSRRRREIIRGVGEAQQPLRAMRTKAREGFIKALRDAHRWLDELLFDQTHTIESLAVREGKSERSIRMTLSLAFISPVLTESAIEGRPSARILRQAPDRPADALVRAMARPGTAGAGSGWRAGLGRSIPLRSARR